MKLLNKTQSGRSMVEMLGVLAIIGVLSVGGIAGYSKAMNKHKINKTIDEITTISQNLRTLCLDGGDRCSGGLYCQANTSAPQLKAGCPILKDLKLIPDDMLDEDTNNLVHSFNGNVQIMAASDYFYISYCSIPKEACISLATLDWTSVSSGISYLSVSVGHPSATAYSKEYATKNNITLTRENSLPMPVDVASEVCIHNSPCITMNFY